LFVLSTAVDFGPQKCGEQVRPPKVSDPIDDAIKQVKKTILKYPKINNQRKNKRFTIPFLRAYNHCQL